LGARQVKTTFIVNMTAGRGRTRLLWPELRRLLADEAQVHLTRAPGHATELARAAVAEGAECVAAVGGDGTAAEVAAGLLHGDVPMAVIPTGAGCDIARALGLPSEPRRCLKALLDGDLSLRRMDVGSINRRLYLTVAGVGFDAEVAAEDARTRRPGMNGTWPYLLAIAKVLLRYRPTPLLLRLDDGEQRGRYLLVAICNTRYYAGGMCIAPDADAEDGLFDVVAVGDLSVWETLVTLPQVYRGTHRHHPKINFYRSSTVEVEAPDVLVTHAGGEIVGTTPVHASILPKALPVMVLEPAKGQSPGPA
jgi:diacylglycerol kinase (ATP)